jgi:hypothetical protein
MKKVIIFALWIATLMGCASKNEEAATPDPPKVVLNNPAKASLSFPAQNEACTSGTVISETKSSLVFRWTVSANTDSYELVLKDLITQQITRHQSTTNSLEIMLDRNTPYSWSVISKAKNVTETAQTDTWKFYNAGPGAVSYAPFPAEMISPAFAESVDVQNGQVTLVWKGSDVDNDLVNYNVYFGKVANPPVLKVGVTTSSLTAEVSGKETYYWKVISVDSKGNTSDSGVYQFTTR